jgi:hypothetical protein
MSGPIICEIRGKVRVIEGARCVRIPALTPSHVIVGERIEVTATGITARAELLQLNERWMPLDAPRIEHVSGDYIATVRVNLGTRRGFRAAREAKAAIDSEFYATAYDDRTESLSEMEARKCAAILAAFAAHDEVTA